jgi:predicted permease
VRAFSGSRRLLRHEPGLALVVVGTIAAGIGASTALFVYLASFLFPMLPAVDPGRLLQIHFGTAEDPTALSSFAEFRAVADAGALESVTVEAGAAATVTRNGASQFAWGRTTTPAYFRIFAARPALGRLFGAGEDVAAGDPPVVLSHRLWRTLCGADPSILGQPIELNGRRHTVIGVLPRDFQGTGYASEWFVPIEEIDLLTGIARLGDPAAKFLHVWGMVPRGRQGLESARQALAGVARALDSEAPLAEGQKRRLMLEPATLFGAVDDNDPYFVAARALAAAAILFLLLAAANVSGLLLARATSRDREWAVRKAIGASPARLAGAIVGELAPLFALGLAGAVAVAAAILRTIEAAVIEPMGGLGASWAVEKTSFLHLDLRAATFAAGATLVALLVVVAAPLARVVRRDPAGVLRAEAAGAGGSRQTLTARRLLVGGEIALAVVLLVGGTLLARTLLRYAAADPGFDTGGLVMATVYLPPSSSGAADGAEFYRRLVERASALPGVSGVTLAQTAPNAGFARTLKAAPAGTAGGELQVAYNLVGTGYLTTLGVPMVAGRDLDARDRPGSAPVAVISRALAEKLWGDPARALGRRLRVDLPPRPGQAGPEFEVVGVSANAGVTSPAEPARPWIFLAYGQRILPRMQLVLRTTAPQARLEPELRDAVAAIRVDASIIEVLSASGQLSRALQGPRMNARIAGGLAIAGVGTALLGLVALQIFTVRLRRRDIAVRMALGATRRQVTAQMLGEAMRLSAGGAVAGLVAAAAASRMLTTLLFGVSALDPWTFAAVPLLLAGSVLVASWLATRGASRVDPAESLRAL